MADRTMQRVQRTARAVPEGSRILGYLSEVATRATLVAAAEAGYSPLGAVSEGLIALVGQAALQPHTVKQFAGLCIRAILQEEGFIVEKAGVRLSNDPVFRTGAVYRRAAPTKSLEESELLARLLDSLTPQEVEFAIEHLKARRHVSNKT